MDTVVVLLGIIGIAEAIAIAGLARENWKLWTSLDESHDLAKEALDLAVEANREMLGRMNERFPIALRSYKLMKDREQGQGRIDWVVALALIVSALVVCLLLWQ